MFPRFVAAARRVAVSSYRRLPAPVQRLAKKLLRRPVSTAGRPAPSNGRLPAEPPAPVTTQPPRLTVIAVACNDQGRIEPFVASVRRQSLEAFDLLIVDNASTDHSFDEALACATTDARVRVMSATAQLAVGDARRAAIGHAVAPVSVCLPISELADGRLLARQVASPPVEGERGEVPLGHTVRSAAFGSPSGGGHRLIEAKPYRNEVALGALTDFGGVILSPAVRYHLDELAPLDDELGAHGLDSLVLLPISAPETLRIELARLGKEYLEWPESLDDLPAFSAMVTLNDWGRRELLELSARRGVPIFAKVEGVQDFEDVDTGRRRHPYRRADYVLYQGSNDVRALSGTRGAVVGNTRLERIARFPERTFGDTSRVVINSNFTYDVLTDQRSAWLDGALEACARIGATPVISQHHAESAIDPSLPISDKPIRHLLVECDALVSRFSTVPFEAMARGVPFVYHNPHGEKVPAFADPGDAFLASFDTEQLAEALKLSLDWRGSYRQRCWPFFEQQVDMADEPSERRAAAFIAETIERWRL